MPAGSTTPSVEGWPVPEGSGWSAVAVPAAVSVPGAVMDVDGAAASRAAPSAPVVEGDPAATVVVVAASDVGVGSSLVEGVRTLVAPAASDVADAPSPSGVDPVQAAAATSSAATAVARAARRLPTRSFTAPPVLDASAAEHHTQCGRLRA
ncbi:MAG: hypothetical protein R2755_21430 [Acidimicrobiales bacterium]